MTTVRPTEYLTIPLETWRAGRGTTATVERYRRRHLREHLAFVRRQSRFYRDRYADVPEGTTDLTAYPPVTKPELMDRFDDVVTDTALTVEDLDDFVADHDRIGEPYLGRYPVWTTSGTTGNPGIFVQDRRALAVLSAVGGLRAIGPWLGRGGVGEYVRRGGRRALIAATDGHYAGVAGVEFARNLAPRLAGDRIRVFSVSQPLPDLVAALNDYRPAMLVGYATVLRELARERRDGRLRVDPALVVPTAETLPSAGREELETAFGRVRELYGATEFTACAFECAVGNLHANADWVVLEPVDEDYEPVAPGERSHTVLLTNLANRVQPLVRYDLGDRLTAVPEDCPCGSPLPVVEVEGRTDDVLRLPGEAGDRVPVFPLGVGGAIEGTPGVERFQLRQIEDATLDLRIATSAGGDADAARERAEERLRSYLHEQGIGDVIVVHDDEPPQRDPDSGKFRQVWSEVG
ncbi:phenylacetate--CoA ligase family protein [Halomarina pelagica]|uniref:phenylacetate--CoA ligase family protein n=1 Tax=Halomarina pelagica TaxID=2961599 RepID=UPI0020C5024E|nr:phenylacetate--CoA ligase family protein [Halomarina sp. BND7]